MNKRWLILLLLACGTNLWAQFSEDYRNRNVDSLENVLRTNPPSGTELLNIYWDLSWFYLYQDDYEKIMYYSCKGFALAEKMDSLYIAADLYNNLGVAYDYISKVDSAMLYFEKALETVAQMEKENTENPARIAKVKGNIYGSIANLYSVQGKTNEALEYYFKALELFEKYQINKEIAIIFGNIGITYLDIDNYEQAKIYLLKKEKICRENGYELYMAHALTGLSSVYQYKKDFANALSTAEEALSIFKKHDTYPANLLTCHLCLSSVYLEGYGNDVKAMEYAMLALKEAEEMKIPLEICRSLMLKSQIFLFRKNYAVAEKSAFEALKTDSTHLPTNQILYECIVKANIGLRNTDKAYEYFDRFKYLQMSYADKNFQEQLSEMEVKYETEKKEIHIMALEEEKRLLMWLSIAGGGVLLLSLVTLFFLWRWTMQKKRLTEKQKLLAEQQVKQLEQEKQLVATQAVLDGETAERTRIARDLHDGLGGMLSVVRLSLDEMKGSITLGQNDITSFNKAIGLLDDSIEEMRRVAHHLMPDALSRFGLKTALTDFLNVVPAVEFNYFGDGQRIDRKLEVVVYRIIHELITNALKHASASHILVQVVQETNRIAFTVEDNGCGFDPEAVTCGIGLRNIRTRVSSFGGIMDMRASVGKGTEINVELRVES